MPWAGRGYRLGLMSLFKVFSPRMMKRTGVLVILLLWQSSLQKQVKEGVYFIVRKQSVTVGKVWRQGHKAAGHTA